MAARILNEILLKIDLIDFRIKTSNFIRFSFSIGLVIFLTSSLEAQDLARFKQDGIRLFDHQKYASAIALLENYVEKKASDTEALLALSTSYYEVGKLEPSQLYLSKYLDLEKNVGTSSFLLGAHIAHAQLHFKEAIKLYKKYLRTSHEAENIRLSIANDIKRCANGIILERQADKALAENFGERVNTPFNEMAPLQSPTDEDKYYFASDRQNATGGLRNNEGLEDLSEGHFFYDIYSTSLENSDFSNPVKLDNILINTARNELPIHVGGKGRSFIFFRSLNLFSGDFLVDSFKNDNELRQLPPRFELPFKPELGDNSLCLLNDTVLIFASRSLPGFGGLDLFYSLLSNNTWSKPINLGAEINSAFDETTPFLCNDGRTLYFSTNSTASMGGFDIFKTNFDFTTRKWSQPENLGKPINSAGDDMYFKLNNDGYKGYLTSNRKDGFGGFDLYNVVFKRYLNEVVTQGKPFFIVEPSDTAKNILGENDKPKILEFNISSLFYNADEDILTSTNISKLRDVLSVSKNEPNVKILLTVHCLQGEKTALDLYFSIKRAEKVAKFLIDNGVKPEYVISKSVGSEFPLSKTVFDDGKTNTSGEKLNQRIDISFYGFDPQLIKINSEKPVVSDFMINPNGRTFLKHTDSLSYKIQIIATKRLYDNDILEKISGGMIETVGVESYYLYTVGLYARFAEANTALQRIKTVVPEAAIVPYYKGYRIQGENAKIFLKDFPDLKNYLAQIPKK